MSTKAVCPNCRKALPEYLYCPFCGSPLRRDVPLLGPRQLDILSTINELCKTQSKVKVADVHQKEDKSKESIRTLMYELVKLELLDRPARSYYKITDRGRKYLSSTLGESKGSLKGE